MTDNEIELWQATEDVFAFFEVNPEIEKSFIDGTLSREQVMQAFRNWVNEHRQRN